MFLLFLVAASALLNLKNKYVQLLLMYLSIDFVIHFIIRYGMNEAILFGGHWMFAIPILLGWLYTIAGPHVPDTGLGYYRILCPDCNDKHDGVYAFLLIRLNDEFPCFCRVFGIIGTDSCPVDINTGTHTAPPDVRSQETV